VTGMPTPADRIASEPGDRPASEYRADVDGREAESMAQMRQAVSPHEQAVASLSADAPDGGYPAFGGEQGTT